MMRLQPANFDFVDKDWIQLTPIITVQDDHVPKELGYGGRDYQVGQYKWSDGKKRTITVSPTGSGKSLMQVVNASRDILESFYEMKQVFVVPQLNIGQGFSRHKKLVINNGIYDWEIEVNCCENSENPVESIKQFLLCKSRVNECKANNVIGGCTAVVSYASLLIAFDRMSTKERKKVIKNTTFRMDEVHHISGVDDGGRQNKLGSFCKTVLDNDGSIHLTTATFFRGDRSIILGDTYMDMFDIFRIEFLEHWKTLNLRSFHQDFQSYKDPSDLLDKILSAIKSEKGKLPFIIVPPDGVGFLKFTDKWLWTKKLVSGLKEIYGDGEVLDLVSVESQKEDKDRLISEKQEFSAVVTCGIGKEGTDWAACSRVHNTVLDRNVLQPVQKMGRALRPHEDKTDAKMVNYIKHFKDWSESPDTIRECLSDRFNAIVSASMLDDMFYPILMPTIPHTDASGESSSKRVSLEQVYGNKRSEIVEELVRRVASLSERTGESIDEVIDDLIDEYSVYALEEVEIEVIKNRLRSEVVRRHNPNEPSLRVEGVLTDFVREWGWDKVVKDKVAKNSLFVGEANTKDLENLRKFLNGNSVDWPKIKKKIEAFGLRNLIDKKYSESDENFEELEKLRKYLFFVRREQKKIERKEACNG